MSIELRKCYKLDWSYCDGNCDKCGTTVTTMTTSPQYNEFKHGHWLWFDGVYCSNCNYKLQVTGIPTYCPHCGSKNINI